MRDIYRKLRWVGLVVMGSFTLVGCEAVAPYVIGKAYLEKERAQIYLTEDEDDIRGCEFVKHVKSSTRWGGLALQNSALERVISNVTHESAQAGANVVLIRDKSKSMMGSSASGDAYICKEIKFTATMPHPDDSTDSQKPVVAPETQTESGAQPVVEAEDAAERLIQLKELKDKGILTEEEYMEKRKGLVDKL